MNGKENKKLSWRYGPAARVLGVALSASMALSLMPCEGLAWAQQHAAQARAEAVGQADDVADVLADSLEIDEDAPGPDEELAEDQNGGEELAEDEGDDLVTEEEAVEEAEPEDSVEPVAAQDSATAKKDDVPEWAIDDGADVLALTTQAALPARYDLRDDGFVTPVKSQGALQTCWAFAGIAAAETSILSATGTPYAETEMDLSERHLAWFAMHPVTKEEDPNQAGEGLRLVSDAPNAAYNVGGRSMYITTLFSQGIGPLPEYSFPYRGVGEDGESHMVNVAGIPLAEFDKDPEQGVLTVLAEENGGSKDAAKAELKKKAQDAGKTYEALLAEMEAKVRKDIITTSCYSPRDDWSIPETDANGHSNRTWTAFEVLKDGNVLPDYWGAGDRTVPNAESIEAMKQELVNGHGVSIAYKADLAVPGEELDSTYMNRDKCAQYTFDPVRIDHGVCIVGYDDNYPASNFHHTVYKTDKAGKVIYENGQPVEDVDGTNRSTPPGNGAWIVKNSWGSETDMTTDDLGNPVGGGTYGIRNAEGKATGYFYLSYYDKTIENPETMSFSANLMGSTGVIGILQHDYTPATVGFYSKDSKQLTSSANVFEVPEDIEMRAVSTRTSEENQRVTFAIYRLHDGATRPDDGELLWRTSSNFEHAGFHRMDLDQYITVSAGQKVSVVSTVSKLDSDTGTRIYSVAANQGITNQTADQLKAQGLSLPTYSTAVVNEGESFLYKEGKWVDWSEFLTTIPVENEFGGFQISGNSYTEQFAVDNFSIKLYASRVEHTHGFAYSAKGDTITATCGGPGICDVTDGLTLTIAAPADLTYDGAAKAASILGGYSTVAFPDAYEIRYYRGGEEVLAKDVVDAGKYTAKVTVFGATAHVDFTIAKARLTSIAEVATKTYAGKAILPQPTVKSGATVLKAGADFAYSYKANTAPGTATVTAKGKGNYTGTVSTTFKIGLAKAAAPTTVGYPSKGKVAVSWKAVKGAKTYQVQWRKSGAKKWTTKTVKSCKHTVAGLKQGTLYEFRVRAVAVGVKGAWSKASLRWLKSATKVKVAAGKAKGSVKATWKADKAATGGYKVFVYAKKGGKLVASKKVKAGATAATVKGLKSGKTYYVRVRPYKVKSGTTYVGVFSGYRAAKAK